MILFLSFFFSFFGVIVLFIYLFFSSVCKVQCQGFKEETEILEGKYEEVSFVLLSSTPTTTFHHHHHPPTPPPLSPPPPPPRRPSPTTTHHSSTPFLHQQLVYLHPTLRLSDRHLIYYALLFSLLHYS